MCVAVELYRFEPRPVQLRFMPVTVDVDVYNFSVVVLVYTNGRVVIMSLWLCGRGYFLNNGDGLDDCNADVLVQPQSSTVLM